MKAVGYIRVSTADQSEGVSLEAQRARLEDECRRREWQLVAVEEDVASGKALKRRPGLERAMDRVEDGCDVLMVTRLDRISRSVGDFASLMDRAAKKGWLITLLDPGVDMTTPYGKAMAQFAAVFAELERSLISQRTKEALAHKRAQGVQLGRRRFIDGDLEKRILRESKRGRSSYKIARGLTLDGVPTAARVLAEQKGEPLPDLVWDPSVIRRVLARPSPATRPRR